MRRLLTSLVLAFVVGVPVGAASARVRHLTMGYVGKVDRHSLYLPRWYDPERGPFDVPEPIGLRAVLRRPLGVAGSAGVEIRPLAPRRTRIRVRLRVCEGLVHGRADVRGDPLRYRLRITGGTSRFSGQRGAIVFSDAPGEWSFRMTLRLR